MSRLREREQQVQRALALGPLLLNLEKHDGVSLFCSFQTEYEETQHQYLLTLIYQIPVKTLKTSLLRKILMHEV